MTEPRRSSTVYWLWIALVGSVAAGGGAYWYFTIEQEPPIISQINLPELDRSLSLPEAWEQGEWSLDEESRQRLLKVPLTFESIDETVLISHAILAAETQTRPMIPELKSRPGQKVVVTGEQFYQMCAAYSSSYPVFITTDSILNAFHILFEDSFVSLEYALAAQLPVLLAKTREHLTSRPTTEVTEIEKEARQRAAIVLGVAHKLADPRARLDDGAEIQELIADEVAAVERAEGSQKPQWLGPAEPSFEALDYGQYRPVSFYARAPVLARYFRTVRWLQSIPFRVNQDVELLAFLMIVQAAHDADADGWDQFSTAYQEFFGERDDWDLLRGMGAIDDDLSNLQTQLFQQAAMDKPGRINDLLRFPPAGNSDLGANFRVLSGYRLPDSVLFQLAVDRAEPESFMPVGLALSAALGHEFSQQHLPQLDHDRLLKILDEQRNLFAGNSIYAEYLNCLRTLFEAPPAGAPEFMKGEIWQAKSCQTALAGWAQMRHTTALQSKSRITYLNGGDRAVRGFIEPNPEFFNRLGALSTRIRGALGRAGATQSAGAQSVRLDLLIRKCLFMATVDQGHESQSSLPEADRDYFEHELVNLHILSGRVATSSSSRYTVSDVILGALCAFVQLQERLRTGAPIDGPWAILLRNIDIPTDDLWAKLIELCENLATFSQRQLDGEPISDEMDLFLVNYSDALADLQLYGTHGCEEPRDDAWRIANILTFAPEMERLHVGVARPRAIYVLYPYEGEEVLCRGAVMPYFEFWHPTPLTDKEWRQLHDSPDRPARPEWLQPLYAE